MTEHKAKTISNSPSPYKVYDDAYNKGRADGIEKCIEEVIPTLYEFDVEQEVIDFVQKWMEKLKEQE